MTNKYPCLEELNVFELARLLKEAEKHNDEDFRNEVLKEFATRNKERKDGL